MNPQPGTAVVAAGVVAGQFAVADPSVGVVGLSAGSVVHTAVVAEVVQPAAVVVAGRNFR